MKEFPFAQQVRKCLEKAGVFWVYQGSPSPDKPHALLHSNKHSNGYVNVGQVLKEQSTMRKEFAENILAVLDQAGCGKGFNWVVGADTSSTDLARDVATIAKVGHIKMIKTEDNQGKKQVWYSENAPLRKGETILHIEELITTFSSAFDQNKIFNARREFLFLFGKLKFLSGYFFCKKIKKIAITIKFSKGN